MTKLARNIWDEEGQGMTEYGLILGVVAIAVIAVLALIKDSLIRVFYNYGKLDF
ncbi:MAG: Flp family type IVb pilin [Bacillota bacterium]